MRFTHIHRSWRSSWSASVLSLALVFGVSGCDSLLQVSNPNNIAGEDVLKPEAALGLVNGTEALIAHGFSQVMSSYSTVTDELDWVGSRDAYRLHDQGNLESPFNEFTDEQFPFFAQARWMADETLRILGDLDAAGDLEDQALLARAHIHRAMIYLYTGDMFDEFPIDSDRQEGAVPLGDAEMVRVYDEAISAAQAAVAKAQAEGEDALQTLAQALLARAHHAKAVWGKVGNRSNLGYTPGSRSTGLVSSPAARDAAVSALARMGGVTSDWVYRHQYSAQTVWNRMAGWVNSRKEMRIGPTYATPDPDGKPTFTAVALTDLIDVGTVSPILQEIVDEFSGDPDYSPLRLISAREMQLIIAEHNLATGGDFTGAINALRALDGLTPFSGQVAAVDLLVHSRATNLFLHGRRLSDHYRFSDPSREWLPSSRAATTPGTFLPIPVIECRSNPNIPNNC